jgi:hypothetical protein
MVFRGPDGGPAPVRTTDDWARRREEVLAGMQAVMGRLPGDEKQCPLDMRVEEEADCGTYLRRLVTYASEPGSRVPAYLLVPKAALRSEGERFPAVLCLHGTDDVVGHGTVVGLGGKPNRQYAAELAERGYVALAPSYPTARADSCAGWVAWRDVPRLDILDSVVITGPPASVARGGLATD